MEEITEYINEKLWIPGIVLAEWRHSDIVHIPKPGKPATIENLRPISLTSCVGKLYERIITNRLTYYIEDNGIFPNSMIGFRAGMSTQDAFLLIKEEVIKKVAQGEHFILLEGSI